MTVFASPCYFLLHFFQRFPGNPGSRASQEWGNDDSIHVDFRNLVFWVHPGTDIQILSAFNSFEQTVIPLVSIPVNDIPTIHITVLDEQSARQDELRELYLRWLSQNEVRNSEQKADFRLTPTRHNVTPGW